MLHEVYQVLEGFGVEFVVADLSFAVDVGDECFPSAAGTVAELGDDDLFVNHPAVDE